MDSWVFQKKVGEEPEEICLSAFDGGRLSRQESVRDGVRRNRCKPLFLGQSLGVKAEGRGENMKEVHSGFYEVKGD